MKKISLRDKYTIFFTIGVINLLICLLLSNQVSDFIFKHLTKKNEVVIRNEYVINENAGSLRLYDNNYIDDLKTKQSNVPIKKYGCLSFEQLQKAIIDSKGIIIVEPDDSESGFGYIEFTDSDSYIAINLPVYPNTFITLSLQNKYATMIFDEVSNYSRIIGYENTLDLETIRIYPYSLKDYLYIFMFYVLIYFILFLFLNLCAILLLLVIKRLAGINGLFNKYNPLIIFWVILILYFSYTALTYYFNKNALTVGPQSDAFYYMNPSILDENGKFSLKTTANYLYSFRGYFTIVSSLLAKGLSYITGVDMIYFYFIYYGILVSFAISIAAPKLYSIITEKTASNAMCLFMFLLFFSFWRNTFYYALTDIPSAFLAFCGISFILSALKTTKLKEMFLGGVFLGISTSYRYAYIYLMIVALVWCVGVLIIKTIKKSITLGKTIRIVGFFFLGLLIITLPQFAINFERGHIGFFPYDEGWAYDVNSGTIVSLAWSSFTDGFHKYNLTGVLDLDKQFAQIDQYFYIDKIYSAGDLLYQIFASPVEFLTGYFKRLFWALSASAEIIYGSLPTPKWLDSLLLLLNYCLLGNVIYIFIFNIKHKVIRNKYKILFMLLTISTICIQNLSHIERRYYLFFFILIYFTNTFLFLDYINEKRKKNETCDYRYLILLGCICLMCFLFQRTIYYNFL